MQRNLSFLFVSGFLILLHKVWSLVTETWVTEAVIALLAAQPKPAPEKGHAYPVPTWRRCDLLGRGRAPWAWLGEWPQPLTETTCSAAAKGNWNCTALPVFTPLRGSQLTTRDRDFFLWAVEGGQDFFLSDGESRWNYQCNRYNCMCCWDKLHVRLIGAWKQVINETIYKCFSSFSQTFCKLLFSCRYV